MATEITEHRQGQLFICVLDGQTRKFFDGMATHEKQCGAELQNSQGKIVRITVVEFILGVLELQFPAHEETRMLRTGFDFFKFMPRRIERLEELLTRFDDMIHRLTHALVHTEPQAVLR